jgi:hypothetical protein
VVEEGSVRVRGSGGSGGRCSLYVVDTLCGVRSLLRDRVLIELGVLC